MQLTSEHRPLFYPRLGALLDCWFIRLSGVGLGNAMYTYFHTLVLAQATGGVLVAPSWLSAKIGHLLRGERANRLYRFKPLSCEISGLRKLFLLAGYTLTGRLVVHNLVPGAIASDKLNVVSARHFTFVGLHPHRALIRESFLELVSGKQGGTWPWGAAPYVAVHVRLGDFYAANAAAAVVGKSNTRIPMQWYADVVRALRARWPDLEIRLFSDGHAYELTPLTELGAVFRAGASDAQDLLDMAAARLLIGSNSTYSYWAAFLGNMPSIWLRTESGREVMADPFVQSTELSLTPSSAELVSIPQI